MNLKRKFLFALISLLTAATLAACSDGEDQGKQQDDERGTEEKEMQKDTTEENGNSESGHEGMEHSGSGEVPDGLKEADNPKYPVGSQAIINADHMPGMKGAEATIAGVYTTTVYALSYDPTDGGKRVENHKWVIHEELEDPGANPLKPGNEATIDADHMPGMKGAKATIDTAEKVDVYMVDFTPTDGSEKVTNHKWVTEDELAPVK
ncbi:YdhK family protein [Bacillus sp. REN3]|uniref:DUF1541 domain-containing protein n=1 Tax=Bacillus sp. REN3 TaxID=2802440 RepID=UPI001AEEBC21